MSGLILKDEIIILKSIDYGETSQILTGFSKENGKISLIAKGARKKKSQYLGVLEVLNIVEVVYYKKATSKLVLIREAELTKYFGNLRTDLESLYIAYYFIELLLEFTQENDPHPQIYQLLLYVFERITPKTQRRNIVLYFLWYFLQLQGIAPRIGQCIECQTPLDTKNAKSFFAPSAGGSYCYRCLYLNKDKGFEVFSPPLQKLKTLIGFKGEYLDKIELSNKEFHHNFQIFHTYIQSIVNKELKLTQYIVKL